MKKYILILFLIMAGLSFGQHITGAGTELDPYILYDYADLDSIRYIGESNYYKLGNDIECDVDTFWQPLGDASTSTTTFDLRLDGGGFKIKNLRLKLVGSLTAFVSKLNSSSIVKNLTFEDALFSDSTTSGSGTPYPAIFVSYQNTALSSDTSISNIVFKRCSIDVRNSGFNYSGFNTGIAFGYLSGSVTRVGIDSCFIDARISTINGTFGGLFYGTGSTGSAKIYKSYVKNSYINIERTNASSETAGVYTYFNSGSGTLIEDSYAYNNHAVAYKTQLFTYGQATTRSYGAGNTHETENDSWGWRSATTLSGRATDCYIDTTGYGVLTAVDTMSGTQYQVNVVSTSFLKNSSNLTNWDFDDVWYIDSTYNDGYPVLRWEYDLFQHITGSGTELDPYILYNASDWQDSIEVLGNQTGTFYELGNDIDFTGVSYVPITSYGFHLDGKGYSLKNITLPSNTTGQSVGIIDTLYLANVSDSSVIKNLTVDNFNFYRDSTVNTPTNSYPYACGILIGVHTLGNVDVTIKFEKIKIKNSNVWARIPSYPAVNAMGALIGYAYNSRYQIYNQILVDSVNLYLLNQNGTTSLTYVGGLIGSLEASAFQTTKTFSQIGVSNCKLESYDWNDGNNVGGIIGFQHQQTITDPHTVTIEDVYVLNTSLNLWDDASATEKASGIAGFGALPVSGARANLDTLTRAYISGLDIITNNTPIDNKASFLIFTDLASGTRVPSSSIYVDTTNIYKASNTKPYSYNAESISEAPNVKTVAELKTESTFTGWDFTDVWAIDPAINDGFPYLQWAIAPSAPAISDTVVFNDTSFTYPDTVQITWDITADTVDIFYEILGIDLKPGQKKKIDRVVNDTGIYLWDVKKTFTDDNQKKKKVNVVIVIQDINNTHDDVNSDPIILQDYNCETCSDYLMIPLNFGYQ